MTRTHLYFFIAALSFAVALPTWASQVCSLPEPAPSSEILELKKIIEFENEGCRSYSGKAKMRLINFFNWALKADTFDHQKQFDHLDKLARPYELLIQYSDNQCSNYDEVNQSFWPDFKQAFNFCQKISSEQEALGNRFYCSWVISTYLELTFVSLMQLQIELGVKPGDDPPAELWPAWNKIYDLCKQGFRLRVESTRCHNIKEYTENHDLQNKKLDPSVDTGLKISRMCAKIRLDTPEFKSRIPNESNLAKLALACKSTSFVP